MFSTLINNVGYGSYDLSLFHPQSAWPGWLKSHPNGLFYHEWDEKMKKESISFASMKVMVLKVGVAYSHLTNIHGNYRGRKHQKTKIISDKR